jgi:glycogen(starch) synthase
MKVLLTADTLGGVWEYALELARALDVFGCEVALATSGALPSRAQAAAVESLPNVTLFASASRLEWMACAWDDVAQTGEWLLEVAANARPDVIHLNDYAHGALPWRAPVLMVGHSCVLSWWQAVHGHPAPGAWTRYRETVRAGLQGANRVVAPTQAMLNALEHHYGQLSAPQVIPNARAAGDYRPGRKQALILAAGRVWDEGKNIQALARVAPSLVWPVLVAGDARKPGAGATTLPNVRTLGPLTPPRLSRWYARASIYALPAYYEPFGLSALEAALAGCALILGDIPSLREVWDDAALFVAPDDYEALQAALRMLIADNVLRAELAGRARRRASRLYTPARMGAAYYAAYSELTGVPSATVKIA